MHVSEPVTFTLNQKTMTYKTMSDLLRRKKGNEKQLLVDELYEGVKTVVGSKERLDAILE